MNWLTNKIIKCDWVWSRDVIVLPPYYAKRVYYASLMNICPALVAYYIGRVDYFTHDMASMVVSMNYWRNPVYGLIRQLYVCYELSTFYNQIIDSQEVHIFYILAHWICVAYVIREYVKALYFDVSSGDYDRSSKAHTNMQFYLNVSRLIIYCGCADDLT